MHLDNIIVWLHYTLPFKMMFTKYFESVRFFNDLEISILGCVLDWQEKFDFFLHVHIFLWTAKKKKKKKHEMWFFESESNHIWRWFEMSFKSGFYSCISIWILWLLKSDFCVTFNATHNDNVKTSDRNAEEDSYSDYSMERHYICDPGLQNQS